MLSEMTGLNVTDINRMRWFAHYFPTFADFQEQHPEVETWERVKLLIVEFSDKTGNEAPAASGSCREVQMVLRSLATITKTFRDSDVTLDEDSSDDLAAGLRKLGRALKNATGFQLSVSLPKEVLSD